MAERVELRLTRMEVDFIVAALTHLADTVNHYKPGEPEISSMIAQDCDRLCQKIRGTT
jgi:hypothetical protein